MEPLFGVALSLAILTGTTQNESVPYNQAYQTAKLTGRPMLVLIGADWCPACRTMKYSTLPRMLESGALNSVSYSIVDVDSERGLANQFMQSSSIPQLWLYVPTNSAWTRYQLIGGQSSASVQNMIASGIAEQQRLHVARQPTLRRANSAGGADE